MSPWGQCGADPPMPCIGWSRVLPAAGRRAPARVGEPVPAPSRVPCAVKKLCTRLTTDMPRGGGSHAAARAALYPTSVGLARVGDRDRPRLQVGCGEQDLDGRVGQGVWIREGGNNCPAHDGVPSDESVGVEPIGTTVSQVAQRHSHSNGPYRNLRSHRVQSTDWTATNSIVSPKVIAT